MLGIVLAPPGVSWTILGQFLELTIAISARNLSGETTRPVCKRTIRNNNCRADLQFSSQRNLREQSDKGSLAHRKPHRMLSHG